MGAAAAVGCWLNSAFDHKFTSLLFTAKRNLNELKVCKTKQWFFSLYNIYVYT